MENTEEIIEELAKNKILVKMLQTQNDEFKNFFENITTPMHLINGSGIILWSNAADLQLMGYEKNEMIGKHIGKFHADQTIVQEMLHKFINKKRIEQIPARLILKNGSIKTVLISCIPFWKEEKLIYIRCVMQDISIFKEDNEKKEILINSLNKRNTELVNLFQHQTVNYSEALKMNADIFQKMIVEIQDYAILLLDREGTIVTWNTGAERIKGYTEQEIIGQNFRIFYLPQDRQARLPEKLIETAVTEGRAIHEGIRVRKNGTTFWGNIVITALHNTNNEVIGFCKVTRDLSENK